MGSLDVLNVVNGYPIAERILLVEAILKKIREERALLYSENIPHRESCSGSDLVIFAGILTDREASEMEDAILEARKIDAHEW